MHGVTLFGQGTVTANNLSPGNYNVIVTDTNGCTDTSFSALITQPDSLYLSTSSSLVSCYAGADGSASVTAFGGTPSYSVVLWSNGFNSWHKQCPFIKLYCNRYR